MPLRSLLALAALAFQLCACVTSNGDADIERMERNHNAAMETTA